METLIVVGVGLGIGIIRCTLFRKNGKSDSKIKVMNVTDRVIKHKRYQASINERSKGILK